MSYENINGSLTAVWVPDAPAATSATRQKRYPDKGVMGKDGLLKHTKLDDGNRPIHEYELPEGSTKASTWMSPYMDIPRLQVKIWKNRFNNTEARAHALSEFNEFNAIQRRMARGR